MIKVAWRYSPCLFIMLGHTRKKPSTIGFRSSAKFFSIALRLKMLPWERKRIETCCTCCTFKSYMYVVRIRSQNNDIGLFQCGSSSLWIILSLVKVLLLQAKLFWIIINAVTREMARASWCINLNSEEVIYPYSSIPILWMFTFCSALPVFLKKKL